MTLSINGKTYEAGELIAYVRKLEKENTEMKCECRRCVYTDCPCVLSDYGKDRNGICNHFKDVFDENASLKRQLEEADNVTDCFNRQEEIIAKAVKHLKNLVYVVELSKNELATARILTEAKEFLKETK